jgi:hypothetical protein
MTIATLHQCIAIGNVLALRYLLCGGVVSLVHRLMSRRHTVGFKRVWMLGASDERIRCDT